MTIIHFVSQTELSIFKTRTIELDFLKKFCCTTYLDRRVLPSFTDNLLKTLLT